MKNKTIFITTTILILFGLIMIYSATEGTSLVKFGNTYHFVVHQSLFALISIILMLIISKIDYNFFYKNASSILYISFILLILVLIPGIGIVRNGSRSWFGIGPFGIQPSELAKISLIIFVAKYLSKYDKYMEDFKNYTLPIFIIIFLSFILILLEPDFGTGAIIVVSLVALIFTSKLKLSFFYKTGILALVLIAILIIIAPYRLKRITSFLNPWSDPLGSGFQSIMSLYAISPSGLFGTGYLSSIQKHFYLPEPGTDFIFAIILEELGIIGAFILFILYFILISNVFKYSLNETNLFKKYLSLGLILELTLQTLLNISIVVGILPVTGITLPFISYGGSSLITSSMMIGLIMSLNKKE